MAIQETKKLSVEALRDSMFPAANSSKEGNVVEINVSNEIHIEAAPELEAAPADTSLASVAVTKSTPSISEIAVATTADSANTVSSKSQPIGITNLDNVRALAP
ncbi:MAG TPA: hypothetical protein PLW03_09530, partial [Methylotenera sp.]|nr:hypothetical protein [Methylotenera sp.]